MHQSGAAAQAPEGVLPALTIHRAGGVPVFAVNDVEEAKGLVATDPVIVNGEMLAEYHPWYGSAATMMIPELHDRLVPGPP